MKEEVRFIKGTQEQFDRYENKEGAVFKIEAKDASISEDYAQSRLYIDGSLMGDAYVSEQEITDVTTSSVGGIQENTQLKDILEESNGSISKVLDKVLFGTPTPQEIEYNWEELK